MERLSKVITCISQACHLKNSHIHNLIPFTLFLDSILISLSKTKSWLHNIEQFKCNLSEMIIDFIFLSTLVD